MLSGNILFISPHPDDIEFSMGAAIGHLKGIKNYLCLSTTEEINKGIIQELNKSTKIMHSGLNIFDFPLRRFSEHRQNILDAIRSIDFNPNIIFCPASTDTHQDHAVVYNETVRAFKTKTIISYYSIWNDYVIEPNFFIPVTKEDLKIKLAMISCYKTQAARRYSDEEYILGRAAFFGGLIGQQYAEPFNVQKIIT